MPSDKKPAHRKLRMSSKPVSNAIFELYTQQSKNQLKRQILRTLCVIAMMRPGAPLGGSPHNPFGLWDLALSLLCLLDACLDEHLIELTEHLDLRSLQGEFLLDLGVCGAPLDGIDAFGFELQSARQHQEAISGDCFWCVECHIRACEC